MNKPYSRDELEKKQNYDDQRKALKQADAEKRGRSRREGPSPGAADGRAAPPRREV